MNYIAVGTKGDSETQGRVNTGDDAQVYSPKSGAPTEMSQVTCWTGGVGV